jgi:Glycosyltransferase family 10 (fucosyltransferase) C-term
MQIYRLVDMSNKTDIMKEYLFHLGLENQQQDDYITEKVWGALGAGTLPV